MIRRVELQDAKAITTIYNEYVRHSVATFETEPLREEDMFTYYPDGIVEGNQYTIDLLNLNAYELREARKAVYKTIMSLNIETIELIYCKNNEKLSPYYNVIKWFVKVNKSKLSK